MEHTEHTKNGSLTRKEVIEIEMAIQDEICLVDVILAVLAFFMENVRQLFGFYTDYFTLVCCITLWSCIGPIRQFLDDHEEMEQGHLYLLDKFRICKEFSQTLNRAVGYLLFAYVFSLIMYLSTSLDAVLVTPDLFGKFRVAFFLSVFILVFLIGSEVVNQVDRMRAWLFDWRNSRVLSDREMQTLLEEIASKPIAISGNGMFTITYSTFMQVMTTIVTFFIIILQFQRYDTGKKTYV